MMMLEGLIYGYAQCVYRAAALPKRDIRTDRRFGSEAMRGVVEEVFTEVVLLLVESGHAKLEDCFAYSACDPISSQRSGSRCAGSNQRIAGKCLPRQWT